MMLNNNPLGEMLNTVVSGCLVAVKYIPTGLQDDLIQAVGNVGPGSIIINDQICNKAGKTTAGANIFKHVIWPDDDVYFPDPVYKKWPFIDNSGKPIRRGRIAGTKENVKDSGPIFTEIEKWWPRGRYTYERGGHSYNKIIRTDTGWLIDVLSYEQRAKEWEGPLLSLIWCDEPMNPHILGAAMSRFGNGGIMLITETPFEAGPMLDALDDLKARGGRVINLTGTIYENDKDTGKPNRKGTRKGLMTKVQAEEYISGIPLDEREARIMGTGSHKSGKVFKSFSEAIHLKALDFGEKYFRESDAYMVMDPHEKYYPFMQWWLVTADELAICWNEWPTFETLGGFYDEMRTKAICNYTPEQLANVIKVLDSGQYGIRMVRRFIDPRFAKGTESSWTKETQGIITEFARWGVRFDLPPFEPIRTQRLRIQEFLHYDTMQPLTIFNRPRFYIMPHCRNTIRSFSRHYWEEGKEVESEDYKDPIDCARYFFAGLGELKYKGKDPEPGREQTIKGDSEGWIDRTNILR